VVDFRARGVDAAGEASKRPASGSCGDLRAGDWRLPLHCALDVLTLGAGGGRPTPTRTCRGPAIGATEDGIVETALISKNTMGWSTYLNTLAFDYDKFVEEFDQIAAHVRSQMAAGAPA
jgi:hypothetical protein